MDERAAAKLRTMPQLQRLLEAPEAAPLVKQFSHAAVTAQLRRVLAGARTDLLEPGGPEAAPSTAELLTRAEAALAASRVPGLRRVINATGVILHTNLGRAPLAPEAAAAVAAVAHGYCNVELDLETGARGLRTGIIETLLRELTGAEAAIAVNNNAAGMLLALSALAAGGEVLVSRGELVEIGGGFRIPDVIRHGGARLLRRAERFLEAGADILFVESPESLDELRRVAETFRGAALLANMVEGGRTPYLSAGELGGMGFNVALYPGTGFLAAARALQLAYGHLRTVGTGTGSGAPVLPFAEMNALMGFPAVHAFERRYGMPQGRPE